MCGICGIYNFNKDQFVDLNILKNMNGEMVSRGPDSDGYYVHKNFGMAMRRLSIIDAKTSSQPITNSGGNISIIFNGEIYNYIELRDVLIDSGEQFKTSGDAEVILKLYEKHGENFIKYLNGMFSICLIDKRNELKILLYRDRYGIKPLYYSLQNNQLIFASNLNCFKKTNQDIQKSHESFLLYLSLNYFPDDRTVYKNIFSLRPGHLIKVNENKFSTVQYFSLNKNIRNSPVNETEELSDILKNSIKINLRSDVKIGLMLSSGIDSSIIAYEIKNILNNLNCYSVDFEGKEQNESVMAKKFANFLDFSHETLIVSKNKLDKITEDLFMGLDEPCGDTAIIPSYLISQKARLNGTKVLLSGAGGDELFGGYSRHYNNLKSKMYGSLFFFKFANCSLSKLLPYKYQNYFYKMLSKKYAYASNTSGQNLGIVLNSLNDKKHRDFILDYFEKIFGEIIKSEICENRGDIMALDLKYYLPGNILLPFDKVTMLNGVEGRVPFLDHRIIQEINFKKLNMTKNGTAKKNKVFLRNLYSEKLPEYIFKSSKKGFNIPIDQWNEKLNVNLFNKNCFSNSFSKDVVIGNMDNFEFSSFFYNLNSYCKWEKYH
jgi:asparagine synthase (glutamine-hydrolysing)